MIPTDAIIYNISGKTITIFVCVIEIVFVLSEFT